MSKKNKNISSNARKEKSIVAYFSGALCSLSKTTYHEEKHNNYKSKNKGGDKKSPPRSKNKENSLKNIDNIKFILSMQIASYGIGTPHIPLKNQPTLYPEQISMINIDFEGLHFRPNKEELSPYYRQAKNTISQSDALQIQPHQPSDYDLTQIPIWHEMKKFNSFRFMRHALCQQLAQINYSPDKLNLLNYHDMLDLIYHHNHENPKNRMPCQRIRFLKMFQTCYGEEFKMLMTSLGEEKLADNFLTYIKYLNKPSHKCPKAALEAANKLNIHHIKNRKFANELHDYSEVNDFSKLALSFAFPHHKILHEPTDIDLNSNIIFLGGFLPEFQITRNPARERLYQQGHLNQPQSKRERQ